MKLKIAVPDNKIFSELYANFDNIKESMNFDLFILNEDKISQLMKTSRLDMALMTPKSYGEGVLSADYRILPGPGFSVYGFTGIATIYYNQVLSKIKTIAQSHQDDYLSLIARILLSERYNQHPTLIIADGKHQDLLNTADVVFSYEKPEHNEIATDLSDDWYMTYETSLPILFWVARNEEEPENYKQIIELLLKKDLPKFQEVSDELSDEPEPRTGIIKYILDREDFESLDKILELLYYCQQLPELPAIKIIGMESNLTDNYQFDENVKDEKTEIQ